MVAPGKYFEFPYGWPFPKFSPFLDIFNFYISEFIEKGQWNNINNKYAAQPQVCPDMSGSPIEFPNCVAAFLLLLCGMSLALVLLGIEYALKPHDHFLDGFRKTCVDTPDCQEPLELNIGTPLELQQTDVIRQYKMELAREEILNWSSLNHGYYMNSGLSYLITTVLIVSYLFV